MLQFFKAAELDHVEDLFVADHFVVDGGEVGVLFSPLDLVGLLLLVSLLVEAADGLGGGLGGGQVLLDLGLGDPEPIDLDLAFGVDPLLAGRLAPLLAVLLLFLGGFGRHLRRHLFFQGFLVDKFLHC